MIQDKPTIREAFSAIAYDNGMVDRNNILENVLSEMYGRCAHFTEQEINLAEAELRVLSKDQFEDVVCGEPVRAGLVGLSSVTLEILETGFQS